MQPKPHQVFLSHLHEDRKISLTLQQILSEAFAQELGIFNSSDRDSIDLGGLWRERIIDRLREIDVLLLIATPQSVLSPWVNFESGGAWLIGKTVIPCCAKGMTPAKLPSPLSDLHAVDLSAECGLEMLIVEVAKRTQRPVVPGYDFANANARLIASFTLPTSPEISPALKEFLTSFETFVDSPDDVSLTTEYRQLLDKHIPTIDRLIRQLESTLQWEKIIQIKIRLREYFEYTGKYDEGVHFGRRYVAALDQMGDPIEALWTRVKHVGYLLVLARRYQEARDELFLALQQAEDITPYSATVKLRFYCHRYLGISFQRDNVTGSLAKAEEQFRIAKSIAESLPEQSRERKLLMGRIIGNFGNLQLSRGCVDHAINLFADQLALFLELGDREHIGIAHLKRAEAIIARGSVGLGEAEDHLLQAEAIAMEIGWLEGQARVWEQRAKHCVLAIQELSGKKRQKRIDQGLEHCRRSTAVFRTIGDRLGEGRVDAVSESLNAARLQLK